MKTISGAARDLVCRAGLAAAAMLALSAATQQRAEALSLASPVAVPAAKYASEGLTIEVQGRGGGGGFRGGGGGGFRGGGAIGGGGFRGGGAAFRGGGFGGGGAAFRGGGFRGGGMAFRGAGFRPAPIYRGGGFRAGGLRYAGFRPGFYRPHFRHRHFHRRFYRPFITPAFYYGYPRRCRIVWTAWGPQRICRPWYRSHFWNPYPFYW